MTTNAESSNFFKTNGYVILNQVFNQEELKPVRELTDDIISSFETDTPDIFNKYYMRHRVDQGALYDLYYRHPEFQDITKKDKIINTLKSIVGRDIILYENSLVYKPKGKHNEVPWHQDFMNRVDEPTKYIIWVALDDVTVENGALKFLPGTHKKGFLDWYKVKGETHHTRLKMDGVDTSNFEYGIMKAGDVLIFHHLVIHGSDRVDSAHDRRAYRFAVQSFDHIFTPRATPIVLAGGHPRDYQNYVGELNKVDELSTFQKFAHKVGKRLLRV